MRHAPKVLLPLLAALLAGGTLAAPAVATTQPGPRPAPGAQPHAPQAMQVAYYRGDPLGGGQLLSRTVTPGPGERPFQNAPGGATHAVVTTPSGQRVVALRDTRSQPGPGADAGRPRQGPGAGGPGPNGAAPQGRSGMARQDPGVLGSALRGATRVTFYGADPLQGGRVTATITLNGTATNQEGAVAQAARQARFAVVERPGERLIVDLSAGPAQPGQTPPRGAGRP
ncbi:hypothetical protein [Deinococcus aestuarii]|uniref:hypothetical protein n=1 Tax=Deinococcus aestuarii TaxID=2774531 RepID=UPI001C0D8990|nr:hypothetical protein [Deinococcus aestuarii]